MEPLESILHVLGRDRAQVSHILVGGTEKLSVVPTSDLLPHSPGPPQKCGTDGLVPSLLCYFPKTQVEWQQEERATCLPLTFSTKIHASGHQSAVASSACPSWHPSPLSRYTVDTCTWSPGCWVGQRNGERVGGLHALSGSELSAGSQVPTSPGIPSVSEEAQGSCRYICACSPGLSERA